MAALVTCKICRCPIMQIDEKHLTSGHLNMVCKNCKTNMSEVIRRVQAVTDKAIQQIRSVESRYVEEITLLRKMGLNGINSASLSDLQNKQSEKEKSDG